ncbi:glycerol-3-phosphate 1-O-acyltransferase PlsY [Allopusillimonas soli]|uniref:Glycerol-3-phosphate acyltransferase n=1 Tax=Allopusillimonas soli TaxID=659016 RepID=A0A853F9F9_9BURK|nr:glycerol-3-phosphate 1-O-acyltransferase PlsY [Allopusillimonas soli]NYT36607.1 glycerol-3-phosphate 1-O-acyltransferase PlsY [Allopusillimonas soli]TEA75096.1 glycerol-3-phosphate 1-O-acyltransferase PlsY [Allopusillimonas soli]
MSLLLAVALALAAYLIGSVPFAVVVSRIMGLADPRSFGSGNPGATNVLRTGNRKAAALTLLGDAAKGWVAVYLAQRIADGLALSVAVVALCAVAVFLGHVFSVFLKFKGGKGVATALGVLLAINPWLAVATAATWLIVVYVTRYSSLAAIVAAIFAPLYFLLGGNVAWPMEPSLALAIGIISVVLLFRHKANISRLLRGKESRVGSAAKAGATRGTPSQHKKR